MYAIFGRRLNARNNIRISCACHLNMSVSTGSLLVSWYPEWVLLHLHLICALHAVLHRATISVPFLAMH